MSCLKNHRAVISLENKQAAQWRTSELFSCIIIENLEIKVSKYLKELFISAGDGVKFNFPMAAATTVLSWGLGQWKDAYIRAGQLDLMYDSIKWPLDYFLKCWIENQDLYYCQVSRHF